MSLAHRCLSARAERIRAFLCSAVQSHVWGNVKGAAPELNPIVVPTADPSLRGGRVASMRVRAGFFATDGILTGQRLVFELAMPFYQFLHGPQLAKQTQLRVAWIGVWRTR